MDQGLQLIELLCKETADDEALFRGMKVSEREREELEYRNGEERMYVQVGNAMWSNTDLRVRKERVR